VTAYKDGRRAAFEVPYDILVVAVGEQPGTFGTPGVEEHCFFMKVGWVGGWLPAGCHLRSSGAASLRAG
jgi:hypothetical protein